MLPLDIQSAERLEQALLSIEDGGTFDGTLILISHDRELIDNTCDHLLVLDGSGKAEVFLGSYTEWAQKESVRRSEQQRAESEARQRREEADRRKREQESVRKAESAPPKPKQPSVNALARLTMEQVEARIEEIQGKLKLVDEALADPDVWDQPEKLRTLEGFRSKLLGELEPLEFEWSRRAEEA